MDIPLKGVWNIFEPFRIKKSDWRIGRWKMASVKLNFSALSNEWLKLISGFCLCHVKWTVAEFAVSILMIIIYRRHLWKINLQYKINIHLVIWIISVFASLAVACGREIRRHVDGMVGDLLVKTGETNLDIVSFLMMVPVAWCLAWGFSKSDSKKESSKAGKESDDVREGRELPLLDLWI